MKICTRLRAFLLGYEYGITNPTSEPQEVLASCPYPNVLGYRQRRSRWIDGYAQATEAVAREAAEAA